MLVNRKKYNSYKQTRMREEKEKKKNVEGQISMFDI